MIEYFNELLYYLQNVSPVIFRIYGPIAIRWYSLAYLLGFFSVYYSFKKKLSKQLNKIEIETLMNYCIIGTVLGARIGFILLYDPIYYFSNPIKILKIWEGGLAFHGGFIGIALAVLLFVKKNKKITIFEITDVGLLFVPVGLFFGRIANFINGELYGRATNTAFGIVFKTDILQLKRFPTQIYEAFFEGLILFIILQISSKRNNIFKKKGQITILFLIFYSIFRFFIEFLKEPDESTGLILTYFTLGHFYCLITIVFAIFLWKKNV